MKSQLYGKKKYLLFTIILLTTTILHAVSADFFGTDTEAGEASFRSTITSANASAVFYEYHFTASTRAEALNPVAVTGTDGSVVYVRISRGNPSQYQPFDGYTKPVSFSPQHDDASIYYMDDWMVRVSSWDEVVAEGVTFEFFSDIAMTTPETINAFSTFTYGWGTCCTSRNNTPSGTASGTAVYSIFTTDTGESSMNQIGNILSAISNDNHFVAKIDDSDSFTSVTFAPNGNGEYFAMGGYLLFSQVEIGSISAGSGWTPSIAPSVSFNPTDGAKGIGVGSNITLTFSEAVRNTDDSELTDSNVDGLISLINRTGGERAFSISFDATINSTKTVITINPSSDFSSEQKVEVGISADVEDQDDNALEESNAIFRCAAGGVPTAVFNPTDGATEVSIGANITITFDEAVRNTDDSELTDSNVESLITLKKTNSNGAVIAIDATINSAKTVITINPTDNFSSNQVVYAEIAAVEDVSNNATTSSNVTFTTTSNSAPVVTGILDQKIVEGGNFSTITLDDNVSDDTTKDALIRWAASGNSSLTVTITNREATITAPTNWYGSETIIFTATDNNGANSRSGSDGAIFTALPSNDLPIFSVVENKTTTEDVQFSYTVTAIDIEADPLTFAATTLPSWLTLVDNGDGTVSLSGTPTNDNVGNNSVVLTVTDNRLYGGEPKYIEQSFTITVANTNDAPVFPDQSTSTNEDETFSYTVTASDVDVGDVLNYKAITLPTWLTFNVDTQLLSGTPDNSHVGPHDVELIVSDGEANEVSRKFTITVINTNDDPVLDPPRTAAIGDFNGTILYSYTFSASDVDAGNDTFTYAVTTKPDWMSFDETATLSGTPTTANEGVHAVIITVSDGDTTIAIAFEVTVHINITNTVPAFTSNATAPTVTAVNEDAEYTYTVTAVDQDTGSTPPGFGDVINIVATNKPTWLSFNADTQVLSGTPDNSHVGPHDVELTVTDAFGTTDTQIFTITVTNTNDAPEFTCIDKTEATEDSVYSYTFTATDIDVGDSPSFGATLPSWLTFDGTATISGTPTNDNVGDNSVVLTVSDGTATVERPFTITVANTNDVPNQFDLISPQGSITQIENNIDFYWHESEDIDKDALNYIVYIEGTNSFFQSEPLDTNSYSISVQDLIEIASILDFTFSEGDYKLNLEWYVACNDSVSTTYSNYRELVISISNLEPLAIDDILLPNEYNLYNPYPNPFNPVTVIQYVVPEAGQISINIYDIHGREIEKLYNGNQIPGYYMITWDASKYSSGMYFVTMIAPQLKGGKAGGYVKTQKLMLIK